MRAGKFAGLGLLLMLCSLFRPESSRAAGVTGACILYLGPNATEGTNPYLFPNWQTALLARYDVNLCDADNICIWATNEILVGLTVQNFGTATTSDITDVYWRADCGGPDSGLQVMTYAGIWSNGYPAWTWSGASVDMSGCGLWMPLRIYADISDCPTDGNTVLIGLPADANYFGALTDNNGYYSPYGNSLDPTPKTLKYVVKRADKKIVSPADTINYTIWYGKPGSNPLSAIVVTDTLPSYTHWTGVSSVPPDPGWNPDPGPPVRLRWTFPGPINPGVGRTGMITFEATADWGNKEWFEPGSGDVAAPEGERLNNYAQVFFDNSSCGSKGFVSNATSTVVRRYIFWKLGSNDILYASKFGTPDDEIIFSIFAKNESKTKTWWNVSIWDTVPADLDSWSSGYGIDDPFLGWTMTPSAAAAANAGRVVTATDTILTWQLDLRPNETIELRWKAKVRPAAVDGVNCVGIASIMAQGRTAVVEGTGHAVRPRQFSHVAPIVLRTMYVSYLGVAGGGLGQSGISLCFWPLHQSTNFELRGIEYDNTSTYPTQGGVSASIGAFIGTCLTGMWCAGSNGCGIERAPAHYSRYSTGCYPDGGGSPAQPYHALYKLVSNSPVLWMMFSQLHSEDHDSHTFTPSNSLSFSGFIHYTFLRDNSSGGGDALNIMNTSIDAYENFNANMPTTAFIFFWDAPSMRYNQISAHELDKESQYARPPLLSNRGFYKIISSDAKLVIRQSAMCFGIRRGGAYNNYAHLSPNRERGTMVSHPGETTYVYPRGLGGQLLLNVGNTGTSRATYRIEKYVPIDPYDRPNTVPLWMGGTSGWWDFVTRHTVEPGIAVGPANAGNSHVYGNAYDGTVSFRTADGNAGVWRIVHESGAAGGGLQINSGINIMAVYSGGSLVHAADGQQVGKKFWMFSPWNWQMSSNHCDLVSPGATFSFDLFCPKPGMEVRGISNDGYDVTHVTTGSDQCIAFMGLTNVAEGEKRNYIFELQAGGAQGNMIGMYNHCQPSHKFFTAPFMSAGVHYNIVTPPFVYIGQEFWITIIVVESMGDTKSDYCGTTTFTSTDRNAEIEGTPMDSYSYTWDSDTVGATCQGAGCVGPEGCDNGVKVFVKVTMTELGQQTIIATDTVDGSILGLSTVMVIGADIKLTKEPPLQIRASGEEIQFKICWSNYSSASGSSFTMTDQVPNGVAYMQDTAASHFCGATKGMPGATVAYSTTDDSPGAFQTMPGAGVATATWLRWTVPLVGVNTTGCVCFKATVN